MQIKATLRFYLTLFRMDIIKEQTTANSDWDASGEGTGHLTLRLGRCEQTHIHPR